tara:strand:+ start:483 stop:983 length:501 start_codon:yes stop_codon:yes gene_type:complete
MSIQVIVNPLTQTYRRFKSDVNSMAFPWNYFKGDGASPAYYSHTILARPGFEESLMPTQQSDWLNMANKVLLEIFMANEIKVKSVLRINVNATHYTDGYTTPLHMDHNFETNNIVVYLSQFEGGATNVEGGSHKPQEDDIIIFDGFHSIEQPTNGTRRVVLVATYL